MAPLHLLDLPVDILALILTPLLVQPQPVPIRPCSRPRQNHLLPILLSHPSIHAVAAPLYYSGNQFTLDVTGKHGSHIRRCLEEEAEAEAEADGGVSREYMHDGMPAMQRRRRDLLCSTGALRRIRCLAVKLDRLRGWMDTLVTPLLTDMVVSGSLAEVTITIVPPASMTGGDPRLSTSTSAGEAQKHSQDASSTFSRPPLAGLIGLLADPYLRTARLWVSAIHSAAWQPFHLHEDVRGQLERRHEWDAESQWYLSEEQAHVEIDWAAILRQMDPEGRRVASFTDHSLVRRRI